MFFAKLHNKTKTVYLLDVTIEGFLLRAGFGCFSRYLSGKEPISLLTPKGDKIKVHLESKHCNLSSETVSIPVIMRIENDD